MGTASALKRALEIIAPTLKIDIKGKQWPKSPSLLSRRLNEIAHTLKEAGIEIEFVRNDARARTIMIRKIPSLSSQSSQEQNQVQSSGKTNDGNDGTSGTNKIVKVDEILSDLVDTKPPARPDAFSRR